MTSVWLLTIYCALVLVASLAGGWLLLIINPTHTRLQMAISFVAGLMLGIALLHFLPDADEQLHSLDRVAAWMLGGFLTMFLFNGSFIFTTMIRRKVTLKIVITNTRCRMAKIKTGRTMPIHWPKNPRNSFPGSARHSDCPCTRCSMVWHWLQQSRPEHAAMSGWRVWEWLWWSSSTNLLMRWPSQP